MGGKNSYYALMVSRVTDGEAAFNSELQNEPINPDDCIFIQEWFDFTLLAGELSRETRLQLLPIIENVKEELEKLREERQEDMGGFGGYDALAHALQKAQAAAQQEPGQPSDQDESGVATCPL